MSCARRNAWAACGSGLKTPFSPSGLRGSPHAYNSQLVAELLIAPSDAHPTEHIEKIRRDFMSLTNGSLLWDKGNGCDAGISCVPGLPLGRAAPATGSIIVVEGMVAGCKTVP